MLSHPVSPAFTVESKLEFIRLWTVGVECYCLCPFSCCRVLSSYHKDRHERMSLLSTESLVKDTINDQTSQNPCIM